MISKSCFSPEQLIFFSLHLISWNQFSMGFSCGEYEGRQSTLMPCYLARLIVCSLSWMAQLSITIHFSSGSSYTCCSLIFWNNYRMKSRYQNLRQFPQMKRQWANPSSPMIAIREKRLPFEIGQFTVISSLGRDHALSLVMYRLNPDSSRKQTLALLSNISLYFRQYSCRFSSDLLVFFSLGMHLTLFFLNLPILSNFPTIVLVIFCLCPHLMTFRSQILFNSTQSQYCVRKGFSLINLVICSSRSRVSFLSGFLVCFRYRSYLFILSQKQGSSIHSAYSLWMVAWPSQNMCPI